MFFSCFLSLHFTQLCHIVSDKNLLLVLKGDPQNKTQKTDFLHSSNVIAYMMEQRDGDLSYQIHSVRSLASRVSSRRCRWPVHISGCLRFLFQLLNLRVWKTWILSIPTQIRHSYNSDPQKLCFFWKEEEEKNKK